MRVALIFAGALCLSAGDLRFGIKAGVPLTHYFETGSTRGLRGDHEYSAATRRYTVGLTTEWRLPGRTALQIDALYKRMGYVSIASSLSGSDFVTAAFDVKGNSFDFPITAFFPVPRVRSLFAGAGGVLRYVQPTDTRGERVARDITGLASNPAPRVERITEAAELQKRIYHGFTAAIHADIAAGRATIQPEFRYTRWTSNLRNSLLHFAPNQAEALLGIVF
jgi:hypothetical protein